MKLHTYTLSIQWTGNTGQGTSSYRSYERDHTIAGKDKPSILCSSDPSFRGDPNKYNPEELLLASISSCHMLWFLHLCSNIGICVFEYEDQPTGTMFESEDGSGRFTEVVLKPIVKVKTSEEAAKVDELHIQANKFCFIANSLNFTVRHQTKVIVQLHH